MTPIDDAWIEAVARGSEPKLWAMIDSNADDDDWNGATALNARHGSLQRARAALAVAIPLVAGECAKICDDHPAKRNPDNEYADGRFSGAVECAAAIRAKFETRIE